MEKNHIYFVVSLLYFTLQKCLQNAITLYESSQAAYRGVKLDLVNVPAAQQFEIYTDCVRTRVTKSLGLTACLHAVSRFRKHIGYSTRAFP